MSSSKTHVRRSNICSISQIFSSERKDEECMSTYALFIGKGVVFKGDVMNCDVAIIRGSASGFIEASQVSVPRLGFLETEGLIKSLDVGGIISGTGLDVDFLSIRSTGRVKGDVTFTDAKVDNGGALDASVRYISKSAKGTINIPPLRCLTPFHLEDEVKEVDEPLNDYEIESFSTTSTNCNISMNDILRDVQKLILETKDRFPSNFSSDANSDTLQLYSIKEEPDQLNPIWLNCTKALQSFKFLSDSSLGIEDGIDDCRTEQSLTLSSCMTEKNLCSNESTSCAPNANLASVKFLAERTNSILATRSYLENVNFLDKEESETSPRVSPISSFDSLPELQEAGALLKEFISFSMMSQNKHPRILALAAAALELKIQGASAAHIAEVSYLKERLKNLEGHTEASEDINHSKVAKDQSENRVEEGGQLSNDVFQSDCNVTSKSPAQPEHSSKNGLNSKARGLAKISRMIKPTPNYNRDKGKNTFEQVFGTRINAREKLQAPRPLFMYKV